MKFLTLKVLSLKILSLKILPLAAAAVMLGAPAFADEAHHDGKDVYGTWKVESGSALVKIEDCGDGTPCGTLVFIDAPNAATILDDKNPDTALATKPLLGSRMLWGFEAKKSKWSGGRIYDAESGKDYTSKIQLKDDGTLEVKGCIGPFCQKQIWSPAKMTAAQPG